MGDPPVYFRYPVRPVHTWKILRDTHVGWSVQSSIFLYNKSLMFLKKFFIVCIVINKKHLNRFFKREVMYRIMKTIPAFRLPKDGY